MYIRALDADIVNSWMVERTLVIRQASTDANLQEKAFKAKD